VAGRRLVTTTLINNIRLSDGGMIVEIRGELDVVHAERLRQVLLDASRELLRDGHIRCLARLA
jgi:hypothetical protein